MVEIAGYQIGKLLGKGAYGETFEAVKNGKKVALKLIQERAVLSGFDQKRFEREVKSLQKAKGDNVVKFIEAGIGKLGNENRYFLALEYLEGENLFNAFRQKNNYFDEETLKDILVQIISGLKTIHDQNIVHRDLKPENVFLTNTGQIKLLDFGLVKMLDYTTLTGLPGQPIGTPLYIAPEILQGTDIDFRADFYSLGVLIYFLVTKGNFPFSPQIRIPLALYNQIVNAPPIAPTKYEPSISFELESIILTLLSKQPYERRFNHNDLVVVIKNTKFFMSVDSNSSTPLIKQTYPKQCFFRLLHTEKAVVDKFVDAGNDIDGFVFQASYLPKYENTIESLRRYGIKFLLDPMTYRFTYSTYSQTQGLVNLPYLPNQNSVLTSENLQSLQEQRKYARLCIDWQIRWRSHIFVAPFHLCRDLSSPWMDIDIKLIEESINYLKESQISSPIYAGLCLNIESYTTETNRLQLLNRYSRVSVDGYLFYIDSLDEKISNPLQIKSSIELLKIFQKLDKPVFISRLGSLALGFLCAGIDGMQTGIASLTSFSENSLLANRNPGSYDNVPKYYMPDLLLTLPIPIAKDILSDERNKFLKCDCSFCVSEDDIDKISKEHFLDRRTKEIAEINRMTTTRERLKWFIEKLQKAINYCDMIRKQGLVSFKQTHYSHLKSWLEVFRSV